MRISRRLLLVAMGCFAATVLHELPAYAQVPGTSTSQLPRASSTARRSSSAITARRPAASKPSLSRIQPQGKSVRIQRPGLKPSAGAASKSQSLPFPHEDPFTDRSTNLFDVRSGTNATSLASSGRRQYYADPRSGTYANKNIPKFQTGRRGGMGMSGMGMGGMGMGGMGMGGMGMGGMR